MKKYFSTHYWADKDIQIVVGKTLRIGVILSSITVLIGGLMYLYHQGNHPVFDYSHFKGESISDTTLLGILKGVIAMSPEQIIQLGVVFLIATPVMRIVFSLFGFALEKDKLYVIITFIVLCIICFSMISGVKG